MSDEVSCVYRSPLGPLKLVANAEGMCEVKFLFCGHGRKPLVSEGERDSSSPPAVVELTKNNPETAQHLKTCSSWLDAYFNCTLDKDVARPTLVFPHESKIPAPERFNFFLVGIIGLNNIFTCTVITSPFR